MRHMPFYGGASLAMAAAALLARPMTRRDQWPCEVEQRHPSDAPYYYGAPRHDAHVQTWGQYRYEWVTQDFHVRAYRDEKHRLYRLAEDRKQARIKLARDNKLRRKALVNRGKSRVKGMH
jgi:hypothetical protein